MVGRGYVMDVGRGYVGHYSQWVSIVNYQGRYRAAKAAKKEEKMHSWCNNIKVFMIFAFFGANKFDRDLCIFCIIFLNFKSRFRKPFQPNFNLIMKKKIVPRKLCLAVWSKQTLEDDANVLQPRGAKTTTLPKSVLRWSI